MKAPLKPLPPFEPGIYLHHKGERYRALFLSRSEKTLEPEVIYVSLFDGSVWNRALESWNEFVEWPNGKTNPRFLKEP